MDAGNWRPAQGGEPTLNAGDWRAQLQPDSRRRIVNKIMETLKRHLPFSGQEGLQELNKIAVRFEEKIYTAATSQSDYLRKISLKMLTMENKSQNTNPLSSSQTSNSAIPTDPASHSIQQANNQGQPLPTPARQQLSSQNIQNNIPATAAQGSASLTSVLPSVGSLTQSTIPNVGQNSNLQNMQSMSGVSQSLVGNSMGQAVPSNMFSNSQRQMPERQQPVVAHQQQQQSQNPQPYLYPQQLQQQLLKPKFQHGNSSHSLMPSHIQQQQQQQNLLQSTQLHSAQQSVMQPSVMQPANFQQNPQSSVQQSTQPVLQQHPQSILRPQQQSQQTPILHQQQTLVPQQQMLPTQQQQQQQQLMGQQPNATNMQQNQLIGQQNSMPDMQQQQQQQQRLLGHQNNISNMQRQQQLMSQKNNIPDMHQQQLGAQNNVAGLQQPQQQVLGTQSGNSNMQNNQHTVHMLQQPKVSGQQESQKIASTLLPTQVQQSQGRPLPQQLMSQIQSQQGQFQQQLNLQQQPTSLQQDMQQRLQTSGSLLQAQNVIDHQKQLFQSQRHMPDTPSTSLDSTAQAGNASGGDWQEEVYQKIKAMKDSYLPELNEMYQKIAGKLQMHDNSQQPKNDQFEKLKTFKSMLERIISFLQVSKSNILPGYKDRLGSYEKQIINFLNSNRPRKPGPPLQQGQQLPLTAPSHMHSMQQTQQPQSQIGQVPHDNQMNPQMQSVNLQGSVSAMQQNNVTNLQHNSMSLLSGVSNAPQSMINSLQPISGMDSGQGNALNSLQQVAVGSLQQNPVSAPQQVSINSFSSQSGMNLLQPNLTALQSNSNMLQHQHLKQQLQQHHMMQKQQFMQQKQQQQQRQQQLLQQPKPARFQAQDTPQLHQMNDMNHLKLRQQHHSAGHRSAYHHQGASFPISSPQLSPSPQIPHHPSPQIDQQNPSTSLSKNGSPLQSANSSFVMPSPSTPLAPSPVPGESGKVNPGVSALSNAVNIGHQQTTVLAQAQSLAIGTPGISASPLLAETSPDGNHGTASMIVSGKSSVTEQPLERLLKVVKSMSPNTLSASVNDIGSVVSMTDRIGGSAPGNGSRAAVGEDLVAMTKCRLQARNFISQDGTTGTRKMKRYTSAMPLSVVSSAGSVNDSFKQLTDSEACDLESAATSCVKRARIEANHALLEEIKVINEKLINTVVDISHEDVDRTAAAAAGEGGEGTIVKCSFIAIALKSQYSSSQMSPIQPLRLLVPTNYPNCSPILLDKFLTEDSREYEDLSLKAKSKFSISLRTLQQPMSLEDIVKTWNVCTHAVILELSQQSGGGSFGSKYGTWENCLTAA